jgi:SH3 domain-containing YSC84-like protein 1
MKTIMVSLITSVLAGSVFAANPAKLDDRIAMLTARFSAMQQQPDKRVPADLLRQAQGIVLLDRTKAGFLFAFEGGGGVALVKDSKTRKWGPAAFVSASEASLGFQVGAQHCFMVVLLMNTNATRLLTEPDFRFGGEARGTAGDSSAGAGKTFSSPAPPILVYTDTQGLYGGVALKGDMISPDNQTNWKYYGRYLSMRDILFGHKIKPTAAASELAAKLNAYAKGTQLSEQ